MRKSSPWLRFFYTLGFTLLVFAATWYSQQSETPPWRDKSASSVEPIAPESQPSKKRLTGDHVTAFRFVSYNLKNWLISSQNPEKSPESKSAVIDILASSRADIIGLSEIGSQADVLEVQKRLKKLGLDLPNFHYSGGIDPIRHLGILSRYPITSKQNPDITINQSHLTMQRGILDVTIEINQQSTRFIGIHLKSKRFTPNFDQEEFRILEAEHVRKYIDSIFVSDPDTKLIAYGDFNDDVQSLSTKTILGKYGSSSYLTPVQMSDQRGEKWTHYYSFQDSYSRIDFITVSKALKPHIDRKTSLIIDTPDWDQASDHRAIMVGFR